VIGRYEESPLPGRTLLGFPYSLIVVFPDPLLPLPFNLLLEIPHTSLYRVFVFTPTVVLEKDFRFRL